MSDSARDVHTLLLTGVPGIGKTTIIRAVADTLAGRSLVGFYTEEMRERGERKGFRLIGFNNQQGVIAHAEFPHRHRVGKYGVDVATIDRLAAATLRSDDPRAVYLVDEIGKMECLSVRFVEAMQRVLNTGRPVVATIASRGGGFIAEVKARPDVLWWEISHANRNSMPQRVIAWLSALL